ncbi:hypothetical protein [Labilithrix luteola]|uniref:hypothetical protein n=1 Tax=Labilithrix luteola TaxID=1391654 RepID=UPI0011BA831D|nr:hypothetical protein [Labilithrix luteola]
MWLDDPSFVQVVQELRELTLKGAELSELLGLAKARAGKGKTVLAIAMFHRAFDIPLGLRSIWADGVGLRWSSAIPGGQPGIWMRSMVN